MDNLPTALYQMLYQIFLVVVCLVSFAAGHAYQKYQQSKPFKRLSKKEYQALSPDEQDDYRKKVSRAYLNQIIKNRKR